MVEKSGVENFMVEKSGVEKFLFDLGLKSSWLKSPGLKCPSTKKVFCLKNCTDLSLFESSDLKNFENSRPCFLDH